MSLISKKVSQMKESATLAMAKKAKQLIAQGEPIINMSLGEPDFGAPMFLQQAAIEAIRSDFSSYSPVPGFLDLREAISRKLFRDNYLNYPAENIIVSTGAKQSIANLVLSLIDPGDEVILPAPFWVSYRDVIQFAGGVAVPLQTGHENDYKISPSQLKSAITDKTKLFLFSNPCNPSGSLYLEHELREIAKEFLGHDFYIASDEIYEYISFEEHFSLGRIEDIKERVITVNGLSKGYAVTGWRLGYLAGPKEVVEACTKIQSQFTSGTNTIVQKAAIEALDSGKEKVTYMKDAFIERKKLIVKLMEQHVPHAKISVPQGAFYLFPDMSYYLENTRLNSSVELSEYLLKHAHVAATPGEPFGCPNNLRLSYALGEDDITKAIKSIGQSLEELL